jgi:molybdenum cofactor synthesis domain-containing protein
MKVGILTVSDRSARGEREDRSGPAIKDIVSTKPWDIVGPALVSDDQPKIEAQLVRWADDDGLDLILTTGGTGFAARDRTPEATLAVCDRMAPGLVEAMRAASLRVTPHAMLSRAQAGIRGRTLIINLPGSPKAVRETLQVIMPALPHALQVLGDADEAEAGHDQPQGRREI